MESRWNKIWIYYFCFRAGTGNKGVNLIKFAQVLGAYGGYKGFDASLFSFRPLLENFDLDRKLLTNKAFR